jgi:hypothetical protein
MAQQLQGLSGIPGTSDIFNAFIQTVRFFMRDHPQLQSVGILQTRNHLQFSDGGISVGVSDKAPMWMQWIRDFSNKYEQDKLNRKVSLNIAQLMGTFAGSHSEYFFVNGWYGVY